MHSLKKMKVLALVPARSGSRRIPNKNVRNLGGIPLLAWSAIVARQCPQFDGVFVSTDSEAYADIAMEWGAGVIMRPPELAADGVGDREVILHFLGERPCDLVVYLRPTTPFRTNWHIGMALASLISAQNSASGLRSVEEMPESAFKCFTMCPGPLLDPIRLDGADLTDKPNQECPKTYHPNGYVDIARADVVAAGGLWGDRVIGYLTPWTCEIDTEDDWKYAEYLAQRERRWEIG